MHPSEASSITRRVGWLSRQPIAFQDEILANAELRQYAIHSEIYRLGEPANDIWGLVEGELGVLAAPTAAPPLLVHIARPGWWVGDTALISETPRRLSLIARQESWLLRVTKASIDHLAEADPQAWRRIAQISVEHLDHALQVVADLSNRDLRARVANTLRRLSNLHEQSSSDPAIITASHEELGEMVNLTRNALSPILKEFERLGLIRRAYRAIEVLNVAALGEYVSARAAHGRQ
jgi:CRP-like cAMP-binding protein